MAGHAVLLPPDGGERIENPLGGAIVFKARAVQTGGALTAFEAVNPPGQGPPYHMHDGLDGVIYILDGTLRVRLVDEVEEAPTGAFVFIPRGTPYTWEACGDDRPPPRRHRTGGSREVLRQHRGCGRCAGQRCVRPFRRR